MYSFEGQFRRKPQQALGGASKKLERTELLNKALAERQQREAKRRQNQAATCIQSFFKGICARSKIRCAERDTFDSIIKSLKVDHLAESLPVFATLMNKLLCFHDSKKDGQRLIALTQLCLQASPYLTRQIVEDPDCWLFKIKKIFAFNIVYLKNVAAHTSPIAIPLRFFEVFTSYESYRHCADAKIASKCLETSTKQINDILGSLWSSAVKNSYFEVMRLVMDHRVPSSLVESSEPPTPMAASLLDLILKPLLCDCADKTVFFRMMFLELFSKPYSPQVRYFLLPALALHANKIPVDMMVYSLLSGKLVMNTNMSVWIMNAVILLMSQRVKEFNQNQVVQYVVLLSNLLPHLPNISSAVQNGHSDSDEDEEEDMEISESETSKQEISNSIRDAIDIINQPDHVNAFLKALENDSFKECIVPICGIGHFLLKQQRLAVYNYRLLYTLAFKPLFLKKLWGSVISASTPSVFGTSTPLVQYLSQGMPLSTKEQQEFLPQLTIFCALINHFFSTLHDIEFYGDDKSYSSVMPFTLQEVSAMSLILRDICIGLIDLAYPETRPNFNEDYMKVIRQIQVQHVKKPIESSDVITWNILFKCVVTLLRHLYSRDSRRQFCPEGQWIAKRFAIPFNRAAELHFSNRKFHGYERFVGLHPLTRAQLEEEGPPPSAMEIRQIAVLREFPFVIHFHDRVKIFQSLIIKDKESNQGELVNFRMGPRIHTHIRRNFIYEDAFDNLSAENEPNLKLRVLVQLKNAVGLDEVGIDGGGIFREFLNELLKTCFDPNRGFFKTTHDLLLYPNPGVHRLVPDFRKHYYFIGRMLGKAIYENMLVELPFAGFFLAKILSKNSSDVDIHHLASLDPVMYKNLLYLKTYDGDVSDLGLDFTVMCSELGENEVIELKPGGANIPVTESNRITYIHMMADFKLNKQLKAQCQAFKEGLANVIDLEWLYMFDPNELQVLISGAEVPIDIEDLKNHTNYAGGYTTEHPVIQSFWKVVVSFDESRRRQLLKFVTSCSRPPLLGFRELSPSFCIQNAGREPDRLPTASTCMNLLKLPEFQDEQTLRTKLMYAIESGAGFELS